MNGGGADAAANFDDLAIVNYRDFDAQVSVIYRYCRRLTAGKGEKRNEKRNGFIF